MQRAFIVIVIFLQFYISLCIFVICFIETKEHLQILTSCRLVRKCSIKRPSPWVVIRIIPQYLEKFTILLSDNLNFKNCNLREIHRTVCAIRSIIYQSRAKKDRFKNQFIGRKPL